MGLTIHDKFCSHGNGAKSAYNELVANKIEMIENIIFEMFGTMRIIIVGIIAYLDR